jgi:diguanylate cyclase (GGDEF)-like protein
MEDITDRRTAEDARRESEKLAARVLSATSDAVIVVTPALEIQFANAAAQKLFGEDINLAGQPLSHFLRIPTTSALIRTIVGSHQSLQPSDVEFFWQKTGIWFEVHIRPDANEISLFMRDISDRKRVERHLQYTATHDSLTGAPNRSVLFNTLEKYLNSSSKSGRVAVMCIDMDFFKEVNDAFGHPVGDALLKSAVIRLRASIRSTDLLARTGGDEFMIMQSGVHAREDTERLADQLIYVMKQPFRIDDREIKVGATIGIAISDPGQQTAGAIYKQADIALYNAKMKNRGGYLHFDPTMIDEFRHASELRSDLAGALGRREFSLVFQPILRMTDQTINGAEALLRWRHPTRGYISPAQFIPLAEEAGYIHEIGMWVLQEACRIAKTWPEHLTVSVNVSVKQIEREDFIGIVEQALEMSGLPAERLLLEVTESVFFSKIGAFEEIIEKLTARGLRLVLDDFGTGYSSLAYLDAFRFFKIKIYRSFGS